MPSRRIFEVALVAAVLVHPVLGLGRLWAAKTLADTRPGSVMHGVAEIVTVLA